MSVLKSLIFFLLLSYSPLGLANTILTFSAKKTEAGPFDRAQIEKRISKLKIKYPSGERAASLAEKNQATFKRTKVGTCYVCHLNSSRPHLLGYVDVPQKSERPTEVHTDGKWRRDFYEFSLPPIPQKNKEGEPRFFLKLVPSMPLSGIVWIKDDDGSEIEGFTSDDLGNLHYELSEHSKKNWKIEVFYRAKESCPELKDVLSSSPYDPLVLKNASRWEDVKQSDRPAEIIKTP